MPPLFTVSNFQHADMAESDHKAQRRQREGTEVEMSEGADSNLRLCSSNYRGSLPMSGKNVISAAWSSLTSSPSSLTNRALIPVFLFLWLMRTERKVSHNKCCISFPTIGSLGVAGLFFQQLHKLLPTSTPKAIFVLHLLTFKADEGRWTVKTLGGQSNKTVETSLQSWGPQLAMPWRYWHLH